MWWKYSVLFLLYTFLLIGAINYCNKPTIKSIPYTKNIKIDTTFNLEGRILHSASVYHSQEKEEIKRMSQEIFKLKKENDKLVHSLTTVKQKAVVNNVIIPEIIKDTFYLRDTAILVKIVADSTKGLVIDSLELTNNISIKLAEEKQGFLKPTITRVSVINSSPYFKTTDIQSVDIKHKTNQWNKWIKPLLVGVGASFITYKLIKQ